MKRTMSAAHLQLRWRARSRPSHRHENEHDSPCTLMPRHKTVARTTMACRRSKSESTPRRPEARCLQPTKPRQRQTGPHWRRSNSAVKMTVLRRYRRRHHHARCGRRHLNLPPDRREICHRRPSRSRVEASLPARASSQSRDQIGICQTLPLVDLLSGTPYLKPKSRLQSVEDRSAQIFVILLLYYLCSNDDAVSGSLCHAIPFSYNRSS